MNYTSNQRRHVRALCCAVSALAVLLSVSLAGCKKPSTVSVAKGTSTSGKTPPQILPKPEFPSDIAREAPEAVGRLVQALYQREKLLSGAATTAKVPVGPSVNA